MIAEITPQGEIILFFEVTIEEPSTVYGVYQSNNGNVLIYDFNGSFSIIDFDNGQILWAWSANEHTVLNKHYEYFSSIHNSKVYLIGSAGNIKENRQHGWSNVFYSVYDEYGQLEKKYDVPVMPTMNTYYPSGANGLMVSNQNEIYLLIDTVERVPPSIDEPGSHDDNDSDENEGCGC